jgi:hypothetical protein
MNDSDRDHSSLAFRSIHLGYQHNENSMHFLSESEIQLVVVSICRKPRAAEGLPECSTIPLAIFPEVERAGTAAEALVCTFEFHG